jgi:hypothetical protein
VTTTVVNGAAWIAILVGTLALIVERFLIIKRNRAEKILRTAIREEMLFATLMVIK